MFGRQIVDAGSLHLLTKMLCLVVPIALLQLRLVACIALTVSAVSCMLHVVVRGMLSSCTSILQTWCNRL